MNIEKNIMKCFLRRSQKEEIIYRRDKYLTVSIEADNIDASVSVFNRMDAEIKSGIKKITGRKDTKALSLMDD